MVTNTYMLFLKGFLLNNLIDRSLLSEQEAKKLAMWNEVNLITLIYQDCFFDKEIFHNKNVGIWSKDHILFMIKLEKKVLYSINTKC